MSKGSWYLIAAFVIVGAAVTNAIIFSPPVRDSQLCSSELEFGHTVILIDKSGPWAAAQSERLKNHILRIANTEMMQEERLTIYYFTSYTEFGFPHVFSFCKPQRTANPFVQSDLLVEKAYKKQFAAPLDQVLERLKQPEKGLCSPIAETFLDILQRVETKKHKGPTRFVIFSDMLQNSKKYSFFDKDTCYQFPASMKPETFRLLRADSNLKMKTYILSQKSFVNFKDLSVDVYQVQGLYPDSWLSTARSAWTLWLAQWGTNLQWEKM